jgi:hypothetical protein
VVGALIGLTASAASATKPDPNHRVTICHRTASNTHPYVQITVDEAAVNMDTGDDSGNGDHNAEHNGPVWPDTDPDTGKWGDIIPPVYTNGDDGYWPAKNWDEAGQAIFDAGCKIPGEPETTHHVLTKNIPNVLQEGESISVTFDLYVMVDGNWEFVEDCTLTFTAGETQDTCTFNNLTPGFDYKIEESDTGGFDPQDPYYFTAGADEDHSTSNTITNTYEPATASACKVTVVINGYGFDPSTQNFTFNLLEDGVEVDEVTLAGGGTAANPNCKDFTYVLKDNHTYTVTEDTVTGWVQGAVSCTVNGTSATSFTPQYPGDADADFTCSATNTKRFSAPLTPGYWRNHLGPITSACKSNAGCSSNGPYTNTYLPQTLGNFTVAKNDYDTVRKIFDNMNCSNTSTGNNAIGCLAGHLLATKLNLANGADGTCVSTYVTQADTFLVNVNYNGPKTGAFTGSYTRAVAISIKNHLDSFNNGLGC